uniref:T-cell receptor alpha/delta variable 17.0 n=1 Tax=Electrophorus electricus TaxID=8005 RepID=A0A4W4E260_ELEEL
MLVFKIKLCLLHFLTGVSFSGDSTQDSITSLSTAVSFKEDQTVTLSCNYSYTGSVGNLLWYRQYSNSEPQFIVLVMEYGENQTADSDPRLSAHVHKSVKRVDLQISSAVVSDSALYYCAMEPTVTGNTDTLYKHLPLQN